MKLIFITRKIDKNDPLTGFVFVWLEKLAREVEHLYVICQELGDKSGLPENVTVKSFGKEKGYSKLRQGYLLLVTCLKLTPSADGFFVHMHPIYAITAWLPAKLFGKKIILWYVHKAVDLKLRLAHALVDEVLTASPESFRLPSRKVKVVGHGIDLDKFTPAPTSYKLQATSFKIISIGRISRIKNYETLIKAMEIIINHQDISDIELEIYGEPVLKSDQNYLADLKLFVKNARLENHVSFRGGVGYEKVPKIYQNSDLFVNLSGTGSLDKAVLEASASEVLVLTSNEAFEKPLQKISPLLFFERHDPEGLASNILQIKELPDVQKTELQKKLRDWVEREHNLDNLVKRIVKEFQA